MTIQLQPHEIELIKKILKKHLPTTPFLVFGSRVKGTAKPYSDLDLALITHAPLSLRTLSALEEDFAESDLPFKIDIVDWQRIPQEFRDNIHKNCQKI